MLVIRRTRATLTLTAALAATALVTGAASASAATAAPSPASAFTRLTSASGEVGALAVQDDTHTVVAVASSGRSGVPGHLEMYDTAGARVASEALPAGAVTTSLMDSADSAQVWLVIGGTLYLRTPRGTTRVAAPTGGTAVTAVHDLPGGDALIAIDSTVYRGHAGAWTSLGSPAGAAPPAGHGSVVHLDEYRGTVFAGLSTGYGTGKAAYAFDGTTWTAGAGYVESYGPVSTDVLPAWVAMSATRLDAFGSRLPRGGTATGWHESLLGRHTVALPEPVALAARGTNGSAVLVNTHSVGRLAADDVLTRLPGSVPDVTPGGSLMAGSEDGTYLAVSSANLAHDVYVMADGSPRPTPTGTPTATPTGTPTTAPAPAPKPTKTPTSTTCPKPTTAPRPTKAPRPPKPPKPTKAPKTPTPAKPTPTRH